MCELLGEKVKSMKKRNLILLALLICLTGCGAQSGDDQVETSDVDIAERVTTESEVETEDINESTNIVEIETISNEEAESITTIETELNSTVKAEKTEAYDEKLAAIFESIVGEYDDDKNLERMFIIEETDRNGASYLISTIGIYPIFDTDVYEFDEKEIHFYHTDNYEHSCVLYIYDNHMELYDEDYETGEDGELLGAATFSTKR